MKKLKYILALLAVPVAALSQEIEVEKVGETQLSSLAPNTASVVFVSNLGDLSIKVVKGTEQPQRRQAADGKGYEYEFVVDVSSRSERPYTICRTGGVFTVRHTAKELRGGYRKTYRVVELADTLMRIEAQQIDDGKALYPAGDKMLACVEIATTIDELRVETGWPVSEKPDDNGTRVISVIVDVARLKAMKKEMAAMEQGDSDNETLKEQWQKYSTLTLRGAGIKPLTFSCADIAVKQKRRYAVVALTETFEDLLAHARSLRDAIPQHIDNGHYDATRIAYDKAIEHKDAPPAELESLRAERNAVAELRKLIWLMWRAGELADKNGREQGEQSEAVYKNLLAQYNVTCKLIKEHPEIQGVAAVRDAAHERLMKHPMSKIVKTETVTHKRQIISGKVVKGNSFYLTIPGLKVYAVNVPGKIKGGNIKKEIGRIKDDGTFSIVLPEPTNYIYIEGEKVSRRIDASTGNMGTLVLEN